MRGIKIESFLGRDGTPIQEMMKDIPTPSSLDDLLTPIYANDSRLREIDTLLKIRSMRFGRVYGFEQEQNGATVQNLFPIRSQETEQISSSSKTVLEMHTETAFHPWRAQVFALLCVRDDPNAGTTYAELADILDNLDERVIDHLHQPVFATRLDASFQTLGQVDKSIRTPILFDGATSMTYDRHLMTGLNEAAQSSLNEFTRAVEKSTKTIYLKAGEVAIINNLTVVHGRTPFSPRYDGTDRWLKRVMLSNNFPSSDNCKCGLDGLSIITLRF